MSQSAPVHKHVVVSKRLVLLNTVSTFLTKILNVTVLLWVYQYLLERISPDEFAIYPVLMAVITFVPLFFSVFTGGVSRYVVEAYAQGQMLRVSEIVSSIVPLLSGFGLVFLVMGSIAAWYIGDVLTIQDGMINDARIMGFLLVVSVVIQTVFSPLTVGFQVKQRFVLLNNFEVIRDVFKIILLLGLLFMLGANVVWVVVATVVSQVAHLFFIVWWSRRLVPELKLDLRLFNWNIAKRVSSFGFWTTVGRLGNIMFTSLSMIVLNKVGSAIDVTNYYLGTNLYSRLMDIIILAKQPLRPVIIAMHALQDDRRLINSFLRAGRYGLWVSLIVTCPLAIYSKEIVFMYVGDRFVDASYVVVLCMIIVPFSQPTNLLAMVSEATNQVKLFYAGVFAAQLFGILLVIVFTVYWNMGAIGAAIAITLKTILTQLFYFWPLSIRIAKITKSQFLKNILLPGIFPAVVASTYWLAIQNYAHPSTWPVLLLCILSGMILYVVVMVGFSLNRDEKNELKKLFRGGLANFR